MLWNVLYTKSCALYTYWIEIRVWPQYYSSHYLLSLENSCQQEIFEYGYNKYWMTGLFSILQMIHSGGIVIVHRAYIQQRKKELNYQTRIHYSPNCMASVTIAFHDLALWMLSNQQRILYQLKKKRHDSNITWQCFVCEKYNYANELGKKADRENAYT